MGAENQGREWYCRYATPGGGEKHWIPRPTYLMFVFLVSNQRCYSCEMGGRLVGRKRERGDKQTA